MGCAKPTPLHGFSDAGVFDLLQWLVFALKPEVPIPAGSQKLSAQPQDQRKRGDMAHKSPTGTADLLPQAASKWLHIQREAASVFSRFGYQPIQTPTFEALDLFARGIGESTDVVGKEMFHVLSQQAIDSLQRGAGDDGAAASEGALALRPEGTAGAVRAVVQHNLVPAGASALKVYYAGPMFRYERPQKGRLREFHQIGAELIGAAEPTADAEVIEMLMMFFVSVGIPSEQMRLKLNSMGDDQCRPAYRESVRDFIKAHPDLCPDCLRRVDSNPLRAFDCKDESCVSIMLGAPRITDALCEPCQGHYDAVRSLLDASGIKYEEDHRLVRGLDYYTRTVFEVQVTSGLGSQNAIGGGGRYDKLIETLGGRPTPGLGFAVGFERIALVLDEDDDDWATLACPLVYVAAVDAGCRQRAYEIASGLRHASYPVEIDHQGRSLKSQFKAADKSGASYMVVVGPDELKTDQVSLRSLATGEQWLVDIDDLAEELYGSLRDDMTIEGLDDAQGHIGRHIGIGDLRNDSDIVEDED
jgi:histidyl-tRNA synthetase